MLSNLWSRFPSMTAPLPLPCAAETARKSLRELKSVLSTETVRLAYRATLPTKFHIALLPNDILVDHIFAYLDARQIIALRRVCKLFYHLTHHAAIWKRFLRTTELPIPPLPPTMRHALKNLTAYEAEKLFTRTASLNDNWNYRNPEVMETWSFSACHRVHQMVLLPGSQYMVASVSQPTGLGWAIVVFVFDGRYNVVPIARTLTETKAVHLQAKYLTVNGEAGITIAYIRRAWRHRDDAGRGINISSFSCEHDPDPPYPIKYECHAQHIPFSALESICDPRYIPGTKRFAEHANSLPPPFRRLCFIRSTRQLSKISLDDIRGEPTLSVHREDSSIMFKPLNGGPVTVLTLPLFDDFPNCPARITAFRPLPNQNQVLVVREISVPRRRNKCPVTALELHDIPQNLTDDQLEVTAAFEEFNFLYEDQYTDVTITEQSLPNWFGDNDDTQPPTAKYASGTAPFKPKPLNVFLRTLKPDEGLVRVTFYPRFDDAWRPPTPPDSPLPSFASSQLRLPRPPPTQRFRYGLEGTSPIRFVSAPLETQYRLLAGTYRVLLYTVPWRAIGTAPEVLHWYRYYDTELLADAPEQFEPDSLHAERKPVHHIPMRHAFPRGATAFAWDEALGRVVYTVEGTETVHVMDFCRMPKEDVMGRRFPLMVEQNHELDPDTLMSEASCTVATREVMPFNMVQNTRKAVAPRGDVVVRMLDD